MEMKSFLLGALHEASGLDAVKTSETPNSSEQKQVIQAKAE